MIKIWDIIQEKYWDNDDGEDLIFKDVIEAKNMMYSEGYTYEYMMTAVEFHPCAPIDKTGYELE